MIYIDFSDSLALLTKKSIVYLRINDEFTVLVVVTDEVDIGAVVMVVVGPIDSWSVLNDSVGGKYPQSQVQSTHGRSI